MPQYPYTPNPPTVKRFLLELPKIGVPSKVTQKSIEGMGFKSKNDRYLLGVLKALRFVTDSGEPTDRWRAYRDQVNGPRVLASALRDCYADVFETYPDAHAKDASTLRNFMAANTDSAKVTVDRMVQTFRNMAEVAAFDGQEAVSAAPARATAHRGQTALVVSEPTAVGGDVAGPGVKEFRDEGLYIQIRPTADNVRRAIRFLRIFEEENPPAT